MVGFISPKRRPLFNRLALVAGVTVSCVACSPESLVRPPPPSGARLAEADVRPRRDEVAFAQLALDAPSSAGFYLDAEGQLVIRVRDGTEASLARAGLGRALDAGGIRDDRVRSSRILVLPADFTFVQLASWRDLVFENLFGGDHGMSSLDMDEAANRVTIGLRRAGFGGARSRLPALLHALGIDTAAIAYREHDLILTTIPASSAFTTTPRAASLTGPLLTATMDTLVAGIQVVGDAGTCTLGAVVDRGSVPGLLTASHCSAQQWELDEGPLYQATTSRLVGEEHTDPDPSACGVLWFDECRDSDASFYSLEGGVSAHRGLIARPISGAGPNSGNGSIEINEYSPYFFIGDVQTGGLTVGTNVHKIGRSSGWTWGTITGTCVDQNNGNWPNTKVTSCGYEANFTNTGGDSGAPVFLRWGGGTTQGGDFVTLAGLVIGEAETEGRTIFSKWSGVTSDLGTLTATRAPTLGQPSIAGGPLFMFPSLSWSAVSGATRYNLFRETNGELEALGTTTNTYLNDSDTNVLEYTGSSEPSSGTKVRYFIYAASGSEVSLISNAVWYRKASGLFSVTVTGPAVVGPASRHCSVWGAQVTGSSTIISYAWSGHFTSSDGAVGGTIPTTGAEFQVLVVDDQGRQGGYIMQVAYDPENEDDCI